MVSQWYGKQRTPVLQTWISGEHWRERIITFQPIEALASVLGKLPKSFNIGFWSFVFPCGVYANAFCRMSLDLKNEGMKGWAAACVVATVMLWLACAVGTLYKAVWRGRLFYPPGLEGWTEQQARDEAQEKVRERATRRDDHVGATADPEEQSSVTRRSELDGTYSLARRRLDEHRDGRIRPPEAVSAPF